MRCECASSDVPALASTLRNVHAGQQPRRRRTAARGAAPKLERTSTYVLCDARSSCFARCAGLDATPDVAAAMIVAGTALAWLAQGLACYATRFGRVAG